MALEKTSYRIAWIGPDSPACETTLQRWLKTCEHLGFEPHIIRTREFALERLAECDRIVLVSVNRADYPSEVIDQLTTVSNIIPWGIVTDSWHIGSRRSGYGPTSHWQQPWFRWWDSWFAWFFPQVARPGSLVAGGYGPIVTHGDHATPSDIALSSEDGPSVVDPSSAPAVVILCGCPRTADMLVQQTAHAGWSATHVTSLAELATAKLATDYLVWDDSMLPCLPELDLLELLREQFQPLDSLDRKLKIIASIDLQHLFLWPTLQSLGCDELIVKPSFALALSNCLFYQSRLSTSGMAASASDR